MTTTKFYKEDRVATIQHYNPNGEYLRTSEETVRKGFGIPGFSTEVPVIAEIEGHKRYFISGKWMQVKAWVGRVCYTGENLQATIEDIRQELPEDYTWVETPEFIEKHQWVVKGGVWVSIVDHRGEMAYPKLNDGSSEAYIIEKIGAILATHTLHEPIEFGVFDKDADNWVVSEELRYAYFAAGERHWRDGELQPIVQRISQYESDQNKSPEFRRSPLTVEDYNDMQADYATLCDYPDSDGFPYGSRPVLVNTIN